MPSIINEIQITLIFSFHYKCAIESNYRWEIILKNKLIELTKLVKRKSQKNKTKTMIVGDTTLNECS